MIQENWRAILLSLLAANLVFMGLLEMQRRVIWENERDYLVRIEKAATSTDKTQASYDYLTRVLLDIQSRVNAVEIAVQDAPANARITRDIQARLNSLEIAVQQSSAAKQ
jgi:hypothetical protein